MKPDVRLPSPDDSAAFSFVLTHLARSLGELYRTANTLCCSHPAAAQHLKSLADQCAQKHGDQPPALAEVARHGDPGFSTTHAP